MNDARLPKTPIDTAEGDRSSRALVDQAADGIFVADLEGRYIDVNHAGCAMLGYAREQLLGTNISDRIPPSEVPRLDEVKQALLRGESHVGEWLLKKRDGSWLPVEVSARILPDGRWAAFVRDIAERKAIESALRLSEAKFSGIVHISADAIISMDESQRIILFNDGAEQVFGYSRAEILGQPLEMLIPERFRAGHHRGVARFAAGSETARKMGQMGAPIFGRRKNGEEFPADAAISRLEIGGVKLFTATMRDVTAQHRAEDEQRLLSEVGAILASTLDYEETLTAVAQLSVRSFTDICIVDVLDENGQLRRLRTASRDRARDWACEVLTAIPLDRRRPHLVSSAIETRQPTLHEHLDDADLVRFAQSEEHLRALRGLDARSAIVVPLLARDQLLGAIAFVSSSVARPHGAQDLRLAEALALRAAHAIDNARLYRTAQRAIRARDEVLGVVAHDLRNPLAAILMQAQLLKSRSVDPDSRTLATVDAIRRSVNRMNRMIEDLLDVTKMEGGHLKVDREQVGSAQCVAELVEVQRPLTTAASIDLRADIARDAPTVWADRDRLLQILENLVGNAVKFTGPGGCITVGVAARDDQVVFWVADTGAGIAAEDLPHVFDRFWQAPARDHRGAGLGLQIVKGLVEAHGGRIWVESAVGHGATFFFTIPTAPS